MSYRFPILCSECKKFKPFIKNNMIDGGWVFHLQDTHGIPYKTTEEWLNKDLNDRLKFLSEARKVVA